MDNKLGFIARMESESERKWCSCWWFIVGVSELRLLIMAGLQNAVHTEDLSNE